MKKLILFVLAIFIGILTGCSFLNILPNPGRDKWYMEHPIDISKLYFVREGMTKQEVLEKWGRPFKRIERKDIWIYRFPDLASETIYVRFENGIVVKKWTSW